MKKEMSVRQIFIDTLEFIGNNKAILVFMTFLSFIGSYLPAALNISLKNPFFGFLYAMYIYGFYYLFVALYCQNKPLITKEKLVDSFIKLIIITALSLCFIMCGKIVFHLIYKFGRSLVGFPDIYHALQSSYRFMVNHPYLKLVIYLGITTLLSLSFFIPGFAWVATIDKKDNSIISAYAKVKGHYLKVITSIFIIFGVLPLFIGFVELKSSPIVMSVMHAMLAVFQLVAYLQIYDKFYPDENDNC
ncbi:MAG: hypothetical protein E7016_05145 [Alphaproteobacteria bacterium]|nr:hypothetical protein [Alphaproteobacteria bacterium]